MTTEELKGRIKKFVLAVILLIKLLPQTPENQIFIKQLIRSISSIGANYAEAIFAHTKQDFLHTMNICRKEASETIYWLELLVAMNPKFEEEFNEFIDEGKQLLKIFISSIMTTKERYSTHKS